MSSVPRLLDVCKTMVTAIETALEYAGAPGAGQVYIGWPTGVEEVQKLGQPGANGSITVYPMKGAENATRYPGTPFMVQAPSNSLIAIATGKTLAFTGVSDKAYNVHGFFARKLVDAYMGTTAGQTLAQVATAYAAAINALAVGVTATSLGNVVTIAGANWLQVNIGSSGTFAVEELRIKRTMQVTVWINDPAARWAASDAIISGLGTSDNHFLTLSDGTQAYIAYLTDILDDSSESSYSLFAHHILFEVEYGQISTATGYQVEGFETITEVNGGPSTTIAFG